MNSFLQFITDGDHFALLLSSMVSISATISSVITAVHKSNSEFHEKAMALYFEKQTSAYMELYEIAAELERDLEESEERDIRQLIMAAKKAEIVSPPHVAEVIDNFCSIYVDYLEKTDQDSENRKDIREFQDSLKIMTIYIRGELLRFDFQDSNSKKRRKRLKKMYYKSEKKADKVRVKKRKNLSK